ncbi:DUF2189 domain-containing protein [Devosia sp. XJ19-1]|uniref:DUF2189 domain-containing protein n=1 Tax=Devosia ureilytica TaxID=2952754 RepID=A0A9Q4APQ7_9HYPH|nr:DUF2189 domain-containing protein [Devosia ureilytica]MCP8884480.1 DUF2189 domain-containing protein [Devosia ureilytica]MCP8888088.1 DUF2189 domain-containing protein [Devosia ureilytica]
MTQTADILPPHEPALPRAVNHNRHLPASAPLAWLAAGWRDLWTQPGTSLAYGLGVTLVSYALIYAMFTFGWAQILFPALAGFLVVGPLLATGLYVKSRKLAAREKVTLTGMLFPHGGMHLFFVGAVLMTLMLVWVRAAVLLYALFFGWRPFPGFDQITTMLFTTPPGLGMLIVGTAIGGLFAAFSYAIGAFSIPLVLDRHHDAFSAMGLSLSYVTNNMPATMVWAILVVGLVLVSLATGLLGLILIFPLLGHATWHAYVAVRSN